MNMINKVSPGEKRVGKALGNECYTDARIPDPNKDQIDDPPGAQAASSTGSPTDERDTTAAAPVSGD